MSTIGSLASEVLYKVENRTSDLARAYVWLQRAIQEIAGNQDFRNEFDELAVWGPKFNLTIGTQEYNESSFITGPDLVMATMDIMIWTDYPTNSIRRKLDYTDFQEADKFTLNNTLPTKWYRFGSYIGFYGIPDKAYQTQARVLKKHPISSPIETTVILLPDDWEEVIEVAAAEKGYTELKQYEAAASLHRILHGDPKHPERPGMLYGRKKKKEKESWRTQGSLRPVSRPYSFGGRR